MRQISIASSSDQKEVLAFLEKQELIVHAWLIREVSHALQRYTDWESVVICRLHDELVGVAHIIDQRKFPEDARQPGFKPGNDYEVRMDAVDRKTVEALIEAFPIDALGEFWIFRPMIQEYLQELPNATRTDGDLYFTVSPECFRPVTGEEVIELTAADAHLFEGCEKQHLLDHDPERSRPFAIIRNSRVATSVGTFVAKPKTETKNQTTGISDLYTETQYRRMGLGKQLVSHVTEIILHDGHDPIYWTEPENTASRALAMKLGYQQVGQVMVFHWVKET